MKKSKINPEKNSIVINKKLSRLFQDTGWKNLAKYRCNICGFEVGKYKEESEGYDCVRPEMKKHIISSHPEYCYGCLNCELKFSTMDDFKLHTH